MLSEVGEYIRTCGKRAVAMRQSVKATTTFLVALAALPLYFLLRNYIVEWQSLALLLVACWLTGTAVALFHIAQFMVWRDTRSDSTALLADPITYVELAQLAATDFGWNFEFDASKRMISRTAFAKRAAAARWSWKRGTIRTA